MPLKPLTFQEYAPDLDPISLGACQDMTGWYPTEKGFRTLPPLGRISTGLPTTCLGAYTAPLLGTEVIVLATASALYLDVNGTLVLGVAGLMNTQNRWRFATYGQDLIAVDGVDVPYYYNLTSGLWAPLPGNPPVASLVATTDYAVVLVPPNSQNLYSNLSPTASWVPNIQTEVYAYNLANIPGNITAVTRKRSYLAVYRANAIQSATFVGSDIGWDFGSPGTISLSVGAASQECVINTGDYDYILGPDDFWQFDGYNLNRVPNHVKEWFFRDLNQGAIANVAGRYDILRDLIVWHYPSNTTTRGQAGLLDSYIGFYQRPNPPRWFFGRLNVDLPLSTPAPDPSHSATTPDSGVVLLDHSLFLYDDLNPPAIVSGTFITSNDFGDRQFIYQTRRVNPGFTVRPVPSNTGAPAARLTPLVQMINGTTPVAAPTVALTDDGWFNAMVSGRLTRFQVSVYGAAEIAQGSVDQDAVGEV